jgi:hypothetical protein
MPNNSTVQRIRCYPMIQDRCALVVKPRLAFWDWVNDHNQYQLAVRPKGNEGRVYLINDRILGVGLRKTGCVFLKMRWRRGAETSVFGQSAPEHNLRNGLPTTII